MNLSRAIFVSKALRAEEKARKTQKEQEAFSKLPKDEQAKIQLQNVLKKRPLYYMDTGYASNLKNKLVRPFFICSVLLGVILTLVLFLAGTPKLLEMLGVLAVCLPFIISLLLFVALWFVTKKKLLATADVMERETYARWLITFNSFLQNLDLDLLVSGSKLSHLVLDQEKNIVTDIHHLINATFGTERKKSTSFRALFNSLVNEKIMAELGLLENIELYEKKFGRVLARK